MIKKRPNQEYKSTCKRFLKEWVHTILAVLIIYLTLYVLLPTVLSTKSPLMVVVSGSMTPTLHVGDIIVIQAQKQYNIQDIVVFKTFSYQNPIVHRIIGKQNSFYITKGDGNNFPDPGIITPLKGISVEDLQGKVIFVIPKIGYPKYLLSRLFTT